MNRFLVFLCSFSLAIFMCSGCCHPNRVVNVAPTESAAGNDIFKSVVMLEVNFLFAESSISATGFAIDKQHILTAGHFCSAVVEGSLLPWLEDTIIIHYLNNNMERVSTEGGAIEAVDEDLDLCVIKKERHGIVPLILEEEYLKSVHIGDKIKTVGAPLGFFPTRTSGEVVYVKYDKDIESIKNRLISTIPVASGNSGGPIISESGKVVGLLVAVSRQYTHISVAVSSDVILEFLKENGK